MNSKRIMMVLTILVAVVLATTLAVAQAPAGGQGGAPAAGGQGGPGGPGGPGRGAGGPGGGGGGRGGRGGPVFTVTTSAWADGDVIPAKYVNAGDKKSPAFDFKWVQAGADAMPPMTLQSYAIIFHDIENAPTAATGSDTLHWMIWDIPGTAKGLTEGLPMGDLPDGSKQCACNIGRGAYFGPGAGPGPYHHYVFEFYALDTKLNLPSTTSREDAYKAMLGHVVGKAAYVGRYHQ
jgi:Raf kinase inhibitor-like YbhB/YbcL family protein